MKIIIDTDIAIDFLRGDKTIENILSKLWENNITNISILSVYELFAGMKKNEKEDTLNFINASAVEPVSLKIAEYGGELFKKYRKTGITLTTVDCLIMATAYLKKYKIFTGNIKHYPEKELIYYP
ncbi:MAG: PIN domain-containing protein [bacterium]